MGHLHRPPLPPWARDHRTGRFHGPPPLPGQFRGPGVGAAIGAGLFQALGAKQQAGEGHVLVAMRPALYLLLLVGPVALLLRRRYPVAVFAVAAAASLGFAALAEPHWFWTVAPIVALFQLGGCGRRTMAFVSAGVAYAAYLLVFWVFADPIGVREAARPGLREALLLAVALAGAILLGGIARIKSEQMAQMVKVRAERERAEQEQQRRQASEERLRIARELHDVIGHHLSLINVQAGVGLHLMDSRPEQAREALSAIKTASSEALREVRSVLGALRTEDEAAPRQPALGLSRLDDLTADAGLPVETRLTGETRPLPPEVDRAAYRIVQEALTNVRRHAGEGASATVSVDYLPTALHLAVRNNTASAPAPPEAGPPGTGIAGMRARAQSLGGTLEAGPVKGGFLVSVLLPTGDDAAGLSPGRAAPGRPAPGPAAPGPATFDAAASGAAASGSESSGAAASGSAPSGAAASGSASSGAAASGSAPSGVAASGSASSGVAASGSAPSGAASSGAASSSAAASGAASSDTAPSGAAPSRAAFGSAALGPSTLDPVEPSSAVPGPGALTAGNGTTDATTTTATTAGAGAVSGGTTTAPTASSGPVSSGATTTTEPTASRSAAGRGAAGGGTAAPVSTRRAVEDGTTGGTSNVGAGARKAGTTGSGRPVGEGVAE